jgi:hypothetical protein
MKDFTTSKAEKLIEGVQIDGKDIYMNLSAGNMMKTAGFANRIDVQDPEQMDKMAQMLFTAESYELVSMLDMEDFVTLLDLVNVMLSEQEKTISERFRAE